MLSLMQRMLSKLWNRLLDAGFDLAMAGLRVTDRRFARSELAYFLLVKPFRQLAIFSLRRVAELPPKKPAALPEPLKPRYWRGIAGGGTRRQKTRAFFHRSPERKRLTEPPCKMANCPAASSSHPTRASN